MRKNRVFRFLPLRWWDLLIYAAFIGLFVYACLGIDFRERVVSTGARSTLIWTSLGAQMAVLHFLHRWIRNAANFLFLLLVGGAFLWLFFTVKAFAFETLNAWNVVSMALWLPFLAVLQLFRILKLNFYGDELAVPISRTAFVGEAKLIDLFCLIIGLFVIVGLPCWINLV